MAVNVPIPQSPSEETFPSPGKPCTVAVTNTGSNPVDYYVEDTHTGYGDTTADLKTGGRVEVGATAYIRVGRVLESNGPGILHLRGNGGTSTVHATIAANSI